MTTHRLNFFPLGNADCCRIDLDSGDQILIDYAAMRDPDGKDDLRIDLPLELRKDLASRKRDYYKVVMFMRRKKKLSRYSFSESLSKGRYCRHKMPLLKLRRQPIPLSWFVRT